MKRCMLPDCGKATKHLHRVNIDKYSIDFCSNQHARVGIERWKEKEALGIKPGQPKKIEETQVEGDNIQELEEGVTN